ncbi:MAG: magnesium transporter [Bacillota bacterium]|nr:magnesium transporter [Bacillota bacterium]
MDSLQHKIYALLERKSFLELKDLLARLNPADLAEFISLAPLEQKATIFRLLEKPQAVDVFEFLEVEEQQELLHGFHKTPLIEILEEMSPDDRARLLDEMPAGVAKKLLAEISQEEREMTSLLLGYRENSAGRIMTPEFVDLKSNLTVGQALARIRRIGGEKETIYYGYIIDEKRQLLGVTSLRELVLADPSEPINKIMNEQVISVSVDDDQEKCADYIKKYDLLAIPVVDRESRLVGIITVDDILDILEEEATEDFHRTSGVAPIEIDYPRAGVSMLWKKRIGWLLILLVTDFLSSSVIAYFEKAIQAVVALAFFIPMLIDTGGNTGTQSATLIIRGIATGQLEMRDWLAVVWKELRVGLLLGLALGIIVYVRGFFWRGGPEIGFVVGLTMIVLVIWTNLVGAVLPMVLIKFKLDPAVVSSPFITTASDVTGLVIYFSIAKWILGI